MKNIQRTETFNLLVNSLKDFFLQTRNVKKCERWTEYNDSSHSSFEKVRM